MTERCAVCGRPLDSEDGWWIGRTEDRHLCGVFCWRVDHAYIAASQHSFVPSKTFASTTSVDVTP